METHLAAIHTSLDQLHALHARMAESSSRHPYFTNAVLNPTHVDILELIRDADAFEASLFVAPKGERVGASEAPKPALRPVPVPTPLKQPRTESSDARTYLLAAEKLLQNYHNAPRARKHIRMLLRREGELQRHMARYQATIEQASKAQAQQVTAGPAPSPTRAPSVDAAKLQRIKDEIQRERMEILALESLLSEHEASALRKPAPSPARAQATPAKPRPTKASPDARLRTPGAPATPRRALASSVSRAETPKTTPRRTALRASTSQVPREASPATPRRTTPARGSPAPTHGTPRRTPAARPLAASVSGTPTQGTPRRAVPRASPSGAALVPMGTVPPATEALERMAAQVWERFGEPLRYARPGCVAAPFPDTFQALRQIEQGVPLDESAPATYGAAPNPSGPLSVGTVMMAHVMLLLMRAPAPHTLTLPTIKALCETWWRQQGQAALQAAVRAPTTRSALVQQVGLDPTDMDQGGDALATRAVYGLVAKKVLRIQRAGGAPSVGFA